MPDINGPNGAKEPIPVSVSEATSGGYGWAPIAIVGILLLAIFLMLPMAADQPTRTVEKQNSQGPAKTAPTPPQ